MNFRTRVPMEDDPTNKDDIEEVGSNVEEIKVLEPETKPESETKSEPEPIQQIKKVEIQQANDVDKLKDKLSELLSEKKELQQENESFIKRNNELNALVKSKDIEVESLKKESTKLTSELHTNKEQLEDAKSLIRELQEKLDTRTETRATDAASIDSIYKDGQLDIKTYRSALDLAESFSTTDDVGMKTDIAFKYQDLFKELAKGSEKIFGSLNASINNFIFPSIEMPEFYKGNDYHVKELGEINTSDRL